MARFKFSFWLDCDKDDELLLAEEIDTLKRGRAFAGAIRDGLRLVVDLRKGNLDALLALFPWVEEKILIKNGGGEDKLREQLARLEKLLLEKPPSPWPSGSDKIMQPLGGPKPLAVPAITAPVFDDDDMPALKVKKAKVDGGKITDNFLRSCLALQDMQQ